LDIIEIWRKIQNNWERLQPIFTSEEQIVMLPGEAAEFKKINTMWMAVMAVR
jgi:hypothetical protein